MLAFARGRLARRGSLSASRQNGSHQNQRRVTIGEKDGRRTKSTAAVTCESTNFYATNFQLGSISPLFIYQLSRSRWRIDTEVFQTITTDCHLKHPAVHQTTALVVLTMIRFLAYTLSLVFYHRQVCSHARRKCDTFHELAKRFAYMKRHTEPSASANINYKSDGLQEPGYSKTSHLTNLSTESRAR